MRGRAQWAIDGHSDVSYRTLAGECGWSEHHRGDSAEVVQFECALEGEHSDAGVVTSDGVYFSVRCGVGESGGEGAEKMTWKQRAGELPLVDWPRQSQNVLQKNLLSDTRPMTLFS